MTVPKTPSAAHRGSATRALRVAAVTMVSAVIATTLSVRPAHAERIENAVAVFAALDKVTARISKLEVPLNQTVAFGALKVTPRACYSRSPTDPPKTSSFVQIQETQLDGKEKPLFSGWMFAESPGLNAVEHPVFDVWLTGCEKPSRTAAQAGSERARPRDAGAPTEADSEPPRRRVRR